jgi:hypothetical protein
MSLNPHVGVHPCCPDSNYYWIIINGKVIKIQALLFCQVFIPAAGIVSEPILG